MTENNLTTTLVSICKTQTTAIKTAIKTQRLPTINWSVRLSLVPPHFGPSISSGLTYESN